MISNSYMVYFNSAPNEGKKRLFFEAAMVSVKLNSTELNPNELIIAQKQNGSLRTVHSSRKKTHQEKIGP